MYIAKNYRVQKAVDRILQDNYDLMRKYREVQNVVNTGIQYLDPETGLTILKKIQSNPEGRLEISLKDAIDKADFMHFRIGLSDGK